MLVPSAQTCVQSGEFRQDVKPVLHVCKCSYSEGTECDSSKNYSAILCIKKVKCQTKHLKVRRW